MTTRDAGFVEAAEQRPAGDEVTVRERANDDPVREHVVVAPSFGREAALGSTCASCRFRPTCLGHAFRSTTNRMQPLVGYRRHLAAGEVLYHTGARCSLVHIVQAGFFKTVVLSEDGAAQITGFQMPGDVLGMDGLSSGVHRCDAIALTEASVCVVSRARLLQSSTENDALCRHLLAVPAVAGSGVLAW